MELAFGVGVKVIDGYVNVGVSDGIVCLEKDVGFSSRCTCCHYREDCGWKGRRAVTRERMRDASLNANLNEAPPDVPLALWWRGLSYRVFRMVFAIEF